MRGFGVRRAAGYAALVLASVGLSSPPAAAQTPPPNYDNRDENGVDRVTGRFSIDMVEGSIGGEAGVSMVRYQGGGARDNWTGELIRTASGATQYATINFGKISERFTKSGSNWIADKANGATLTENIADNKFTYRAPDGTTIVYQSPLALAGTTFGATLGVPQCQSAYGAGALLCAVPTDVSRPSGHKYKLTWKTPEGCLYPNDGGGPTLPGGGPGEDPIQCSVYYRLSDVRSNSSFGMKVKYQSDVGPHGYLGSPPPTGWFQRATLKFLDLSQVYCDPAANNCDGVAGSWPTVSYSVPSAGVYEITNTHAGTWRIDNATAGQTKIRRPGASSDTTVVTYNTSTFRTTSVTRDGRRSATTGPRRAARQPRPRPPAAARPMRLPRPRPPSSRRPSRRERARRPVTFMTRTSASRARRGPRGIIPNIPAMRAATSPRRAMLRKLAAGWPTS